MTETIQTPEGAKVTALVLFSDRIDVGDDLIVVKIPCSAENASLGQRVVEQLVDGLHG
jgi:hypothetical protein